MAPAVLAVLAASVVAASAACVPRSSSMISHNHSASQSSQSGDPNHLNNLVQAAAKLLNNAPGSVQLPSASDAAKALCGFTSYPDVCMSSISDNKEAAGPVDPLEMLKMQIEAIKEKMREAKKAATDLKNSPSTDKIAAGPLGDCITIYDDLLYSLNDVDKVLAVNDKGKVSSMLSAISTDVDTCEQGFDDLDIDDSLMANHDDLLSKMSSVLLAIAEHGKLM